jgi:hypothetical protein
MVMVMVMEVRSANIARALFNRHGCRREVSSPRSLYHITPRAAASQLWPFVPLNFSNACEMVKLAAF